jgi:hypothetical protein
VSEANWEDIGERRQQFIRAMRLHSKEGEAELLRLVKAADIADLEWVIARIDDQLSSISLHVRDPAMLERLMQDTQHQRVWIGSVLDNKRTVERRAQDKRQQWMNWAIVIGVIATVLTLLVAIITLT